MDAKKSNRADLNNKRTLFLEIGLVVALGIALAVFEYSTNEYSFSLTEMPSGDIDLVELPPITTIEEPKAELPKPKLASVINIIEDFDDSDLEDPEIFSSEQIDNFDFQNYDFNIPEEIPEPDDGIILIADSMPTFKGDLRAYLSESVRYPSIAADNGVFGRVFVNFVVDKTGKVCQAKVLRSVDPNLDKEALRVVQSMPDWNPGKHRGRPVNVSFTVPINFVLN